MARRIPGTLLPIENAILEVALARHRSGLTQFYGFAIAEALRADGRSLTAHGTLYKALGRLEQLGLVRSQWEAPDEAEGRPRRRMYELTVAGIDTAGRRSEGEGLEPGSTVSEQSN